MFQLEAYTPIRASMVSWGTSWRVFGGKKRVFTSRMTAWDCQDKIVGGYWRLCWGNPPFLEGHLVNDIFLTIASIIGRLYTFSDNLPIPMRHSIRRNYSSGIYIIIEGFSNSKHTICYFLKRKLEEIVITGLNINVGWK